MLSVAIASFVPVSIHNFAEVLDLVATVALGSHIVVEVGSHIVVEMVQLAWVIQIASVPVPSDKTYRHSMNQNNQTVVEGPIDPLLDSHTSSG